MLLFAAVLWGVPVKVRSFATAVVTAVLVAVAAPPPAAAAVSGPCRAGTPPAAEPTDEFYADRGELGPEQLPSEEPAGSLMTGYRRFGGMSKETFTDRYRAAGGWVHPPEDGFLILRGVAVRYQQTLVEGMRVDRFGYPSGRYLAPVDTLYLQRALPPERLNTPVGAPQGNYHVYCVLRAFTVEAGPIAPWFGQPGLGLQYRLDDRFLPAAGDRVSVGWLVDHGYLVEEDPAR
ncbi:TNT domain-containing protein [Catenuloplanes atrovinosus]|uniref:TNT domain-containing protein n=1 Tax=Catenuloplanes atrovinosus TaxID=137266 RepID=A0AAE3YJK7_9ACTN|nr:TNT domain-containing protein [Catenuloplanes atrovinosus]MDR7273692.1 hypothetical protein [Catenuloplanes atrovinosus]